VVPLYAAYLSRASLDDSIHVPGAAGARSLSAVFVSAPIGWALLSVLALAAPVVLWHRRHEPLWAATTALSAVTAVAIVAALAPRWACLAPTAASVGAAVLCGWSTATVRSASIGLAALAVAIVAVAAPGTMFEQRDLYARLVPRGTGAAVA